MRLVVDASVAVKWIFPDPEEEPHADRAVALLEEVRSGRVALLQPPHWLAELAAVVTRLRPEVAEAALDLLDALELPIAGDLEIFKHASRMARELDHHLFDTLYHAVAFERDATLVSADDHYLRKARRLGRVVALADWPLPASDAREELAGGPQQGS